MLNDKDPAIQSSWQMASMLKANSIDGNRIESRPGGRGAIETVATPAVTSRLSSAIATGVIPIQEWTTSKAVTCINRFILQGYGTAREQDKREARFSQA